MTELDLWTDQIAPSLEARNAERLAAVREAMRNLHRNIVDPVSADDVRDYLRRHPQHDYGNRNWLGTIWREKGWRCVGYVPSETPGRHGNRIGRYVWEPE